MLPESNFARAVSQFKFYYFNLQFIDKVLIKGWSKHINQISRLVSISILFQVCFVEFASMLSHKTATKLPPPGLEENWKLLANIEIWEEIYWEFRIRRDVRGVTSKCSQKASSNLILFKRQIVAPMYKYIIYKYLDN